MTPTADNIIIRSNLDQKQSISFTREDGSVMKLAFIPNRHRYETNGIVTNPVVAEVMIANRDYHHIKAGDHIILHHNIIFNKAMEIETDEVNQVRIQAIPVDRWIMGKIVDGEVVPFPDNVVCERTEEPVDGGMFIIPESAKKNSGSICKVLSVSEALQLVPGDFIVIKKWADYEVVYMWEGNEVRRVIVWNEDIEMLL